MIARNITSVVSEFLPLSIFLTFILMGYEVNLSLFLVCSALINEIREPLDRFMRMHNSFKVLCETFEILGGFRVILFFAFTNLCTQLIRNFRGFYEKDFYMFD